MSTETIFTPSGTLWNGFGVNAKVDDVATISNQLQGFNVQWCRFFLEIDDPGIEGIYYDNDTFDRWWQASENIMTQTARFTYATFQISGSKFIFTARCAPKSWLTTDGSNELRGDALVAFARLFVSGIIIYRQYGMPVDWVEIIDEPETMSGTFITPENYLILIQTIKDVTNDRAITPIRIMGPGLSRIIPKFQSSDPYIEIFKDTTDLLDAWSIHVLEPEIDLLLYNQGDFESRNYVKQQLIRTIFFMKLNIPNLKIYVTKFGTNTSLFPSGIDYGYTAPESVDYALRLMDNVCGILSSGASSAMSWFLTFKNDNKALYRRDGSKRPQRNALALLNKSIPITGMIFNPNDQVTGGSLDETIKTFVACRNSFGFILSRPQPSDGMLGALTLKIRNVDWNATRMLSSTTLTCFPPYISLSGITKTVTITNGELKIELFRLPYNCVVFGKGDVYISPSPQRPPVQISSFNILKISNLASVTNPHEGDIIFYVLNNSLMVYQNNTWIPVQILSNI
jgi:hypothetical protein